jgi:hypothetical protein
MFKVALPTDNRSLLNFFYSTIINKSRSGGPKKRTKRNETCVFHEIQKIFFISTSK